MQQDALQCRIAEAHDQPKVQIRMYDATGCPAMPGSSHKRNYVRPMSCVKLAEFWPWALLMGHKLVVLPTFCCFRRFFLRLVLSFSKCCCMVYSQVWLQWRHLPPVERSLYTHVVVERYSNVLAHGQMATAKILRAVECPCLMILSQSLHNFPTIPIVTQGFLLVSCL